MKLHDGLGSKKSFGETSTALRQGYSPTPLFQVSRLVTFKRLEQASSNLVWWLRCVISGDVNHVLVTSGYIFSRKQATLYKGPSLRWSVRPSVRGSIKRFSDIAEMRTLRQ